MIGIGLPATVKTETADVTESATALIHLAPSNYQIDAEADRLERLRRLGIYTSQSLAQAARTQAEQPYLVEGLLRIPSVNLLVGDSGLGKTPLGIQLGICVAAGLPFLGLQVPKCGRVLYCDAESDLSSFQEILTAISRFLGLSEPPANFHVWSPNWESHIDAREAHSSWSVKLTDRVHSVEPSLVIVDPLRMFWLQAENGNDDAAAVIKSMRSVSGPTGCVWVITHHRRKVNQQIAVSALAEDPHAWFQEAAGAHALVNQSDTRIGVVPNGRNADLLLGGFVIGTGPLVPLDLARVTDDNGTPVGYRLLTGVDRLSSEDRAAFDRLPHRFRFKDVRAAMGGTSDSNANRLVKKCCTLEIVTKEGTEYVKVGSNMERLERVEREPAPAPLAPPTPVSPEPPDSLLGGSAAVESLPDESHAG